MLDVYQEVVDDFLKTDLHVLHYLQDPKYKDIPFADTLIQLNLISSSSNKEEIEKVLKEAQKLDLLDFNPYAKAIFYMSWLSASIHLKLKDQAQLIKEKAIRILPPNSPPIFLSSFEIMGTFLKDNKESAIQKFIEEYEKYNGTSTRYNRYFNLYLNHKCTQGLAFSKDANEDYLNKYKNEIQAEHFLYYTYQNDVVLCNINEIQKYYPKVENISILGLSHFFYNFFKTGEIKKSFLVERDQLNGKLLQLTYINQLIMKKDIAKANAEFKKELCDSMWELEVNFLHYTQIRLELINKNMEAALQLLKEKINLGLVHFFDNFFLARVELLRGNQEKANAYFKKLNLEIEKHNATNLLNFELNMAYEMKPSEVFEFAKVISIAENKREIEVQFVNTEEKRGINRLVGVSEHIHNLKSTIKNFCNAEMPILILGETGVGKEVVARAIHEESTRNKKPFIAINCGAIAESLLQSELFGHIEGAYTGASRDHQGIFLEAGSGTVFLDEIGDISPTLQVALLRVLENNEIRPVGGSKVLPIQCQILAATNVNLENLVENKLFRKDLYYRLNRLTISVLPLRERPSDIIPLANYFLKSYRNTFEAPLLSEDLKNALINFTWPGNIRQLKNEILRMDLLQSRKAFYEFKDCEFLKEVIPDHEKKEIASEKIKPKSELGSVKITSSRHRLVAIKKIFSEHKELTRKQIAELLNISLPTVTTDLKTLVKESFIVKMEPSKSPRSHYFILNTKNET